MMFGTLERSKARSLLSMLGERDLVFATEIPESLDRERNLTDVEYDRTQRQIGELNPQKDARRIDELVAHLRELRIKQDEIAEGIRKTSPKLAFYSTGNRWIWPGRRGSWTRYSAVGLFDRQGEVVLIRRPARQKNGLAVFALLSGEEPLRESVEAFRNLIDWKMPPDKGPA